MYGVGHPQLGNAMTFPDDFAGVAQPGQVDGEKLL